MELFNIGPLELLIFLIIAFLVLGPKGMILTAYRVGKWIRGLVRSPMWREILQYAQEIRELPKKIMDETGLEEELKAVQQTTNEALQEVNTSLKEVSQATRVPEAEHIRLDTTPARPALPSETPDASLPSPAEAGAPAVLPVAPSQDAADGGMPVPAAEIVPARRDLPDAGAPALAGPQTDEQLVPYDQEEPFHQSPRLDDAAAPSGADAAPVTEEAQAPAVLSTVDDMPAAETPAPPKRAYRKRAVQAAESGSETLSGQSGAPGEETPAPRKRAGRKPAGAPAPALDTAQGELPESGGTPADAPAAEVAPRAKKTAPRKRSVETGEMASVDTAPAEAAASGEPKKRAGRKPRAVQEAAPDPSPAGDGRTAAAEPAETPVLLPAPEAPALLPEPAVPVLLAAPAEEQPAPRKRAARPSRAAADSPAAANEPDGTPQVDAKPRQARKSRKTPPAEV